MTPGQLRLRAWVRAWRAHGVPIAAAEVEVRSSTSGVSHRPYAWVKLLCEACSAAGEGTWWFVPGSQESYRRAAWLAISELRWQQGCAHVEPMGSRDDPEPDEIRQLALLEALAGD